MIYVSKILIEFPPYFVSLLPDSFAEKFRAWKNDLDL